MKSRIVSFLRHNILLIVVTAIGLFYFFVNPMETGFVPQCLFHRLTGLECMGCGAQRMLHALLHGDVAAAFRANALLTVSMPFILFLLWLELNRKRHPALYRNVFSPSLIKISGIILILWFFLRNLI